MRRDTARIAGLRLLDDGAAQPVLDAVVAAVNAASAYPRATVMLEHITLDGDVEEGGGLVTRIVFLIWAMDEAGLAALAADLRVALPAVWSEGPVVPGIDADAGVTTAVFDALRASGRVPDEILARCRSPPTLGRSHAACQDPWWVSDARAAGHSTRRSASSSSPRMRASPRLPTSPRCWRWPRSD